MDWITLIMYSIPIVVLTIAVSILHSRINYLEMQILNLAQAGLNFSKSIKIIADTQNEITKIIRTQVETQRGS